MQFTTNKYTGDSIQTQTFICSDDNPYQKKTDRKYMYIVSELQLMHLFSICPSCTTATLCQIRPVSGTIIKIDQCCGICGFRRSWSSQEKYRQEICPCQQPYCFPVRFIHLLAYTTATIII